MTDGMIPTATNAGRKHNPVGNNKRTDNFAAACSICARSSQSNCSTAVSKRSTGEAPLCHEEANASRTTARSPSSGHASSQETPLFNCSPADRSPAPNSPAAISPTAISARGMEDPCRMATLSIFQYQWQRKFPHSFGGRKAGGRANRPPLLQPYRFGRARHRRQHP